MPELGKETKRHWEGYFMERSVQQSSHVPVRQEHNLFGCKVVRGSGGGEWQAGLNYRGYIQAVWSGFVITAHVT